MSPSGAQRHVRKSFKSCCNCFGAQPMSGGEEPAGTGPYSREWWYTTAGPSGLWYYDYFMQQSLNKYLDNEVPKWCLVPGGAGGIIYSLNRQGGGLFPPPWNTAHPAARAAFLALEPEVGTPRLGVRSFVTWNAGQGKHSFSWFQGCTWVTFNIDPLPEEPYVIAISLPWDYSGQPNIEEPFVSVGIVPNIPVNKFDAMNQTPGTGTGWGLGSIHITGVGGRIATYYFPISLFNKPPAPTIFMAKTIGVWDKDYLPISDPGQGTISKSAWYSPTYGDFYRSF